MSNSEPQIDTRVVHHAECGSCPPPMGMWAYDRAARRPWITEHLADPRHAGHTIVEWADADIRSRLATVLKNRPAAQPADVAAER